MSQSKSLKSAASPIWKSLVLQVQRSLAHSWDGGWNGHTVMRRSIDVRHVVNIPLISRRQKTKSADAADDLHNPNGYILLDVVIRATPTVWVAGITQRLQNATESLGITYSKLIWPLLFKATKILSAVKVLGSWEFAHERCEKNVGFSAVSKVNILSWVSNVCRTSSLLLCFLPDLTPSRSSLRGTSLYTEAMGNTMHLGLAYLVSKMSLLKIR